MIPNLNSANCIYFFCLLTVEDRTSFSDNVTILCRETVVDCRRVSFHICCFPPWQTHSAYMLFYERMKVGETSSEAPIDNSPPDTADGSSAVCRLDADDDDRHKMKIELSPELAEVFVL